MMSLEQILKSTKKFFQISLLAVAGALSIASFENAKAADWWYERFHESGYSEMDVYLNDENVGTATRVDFGHKVSGADSWPAVAVFYSDGYVRLKEPRDPDNFFGTSVILGPAYWSNGNYYHNPTIERIDVSGNFVQDPLDVNLAGKNNDIDVTYTIKMYQPTENDNNMILHVKQDYECTNSFTIDGDRQEQQEGFKLAQFSSMYVDDYYHDSDAARYINNLEDLITSSFENFSTSSFIFTNPKPMGKSWLESTHTDNEGWQGNTPNVRIELENLVSNKYTAQGFFTKDTDPNNDNVGLWINDDIASSFSVWDIETIFYWIIAQDDTFDSEYEKGDVNRDGNITPGDALLAFNYYLGLATLTPTQVVLADHNSDESVTPGDALLIFNEYLGI